MAIRVFYCSVCGHKLRFGSSRCPVCGRVTPLANHYWPYALGIGVIVLFFLAAS